MSLPKAIFDQLARAIPGGLNHDVPPGLVYHYTRADAGLEGILRNKVVWATQFEHLNDTSELVAGDALVHEVAVELSAKTGLSQLQDLVRQRFMKHQARLGISKVMKQLCVASFSESCNELSQWREYGGGGAGYSLGLRFRSSEESGSLVSHLGAVFKCMTYDADASTSVIRERLVDAFEALERVADSWKGKLIPKTFDAMMNQGMKNILFRAGVLALAVKHPSFAIEKEWRAIAMPRNNAPERTMQHRDTPNGPVPYVALPLVSHETDLLDLEELWVGPTANSEARADRARALIESLGYSPEIVKVSKVPMRG